jgi:hypothetical protein
VLILGNPIACWFEGLALVASCDAKHLAAMGDTSVFDDAVEALKGGPADPLGSSDANDDADDANDDADGADATESVLKSLVQQMIVALSPDVLHDIEHFLRSWARLQGNGDDKDNVA